jgi:hypothetical protein
MQDLTSTIEIKSDQLNADDITDQGKVIKITKVNVISGDQPVSISYENDNKKPYKPCKTMRRILFELWGKDGSVYIGRSLQLYNDKSVTFGPEKTGGIRISHMSDIGKDSIVIVRAGKIKKKALTIKVLGSIDPAIEEWKLKFSIAETKIDIDALTKELKETELKPETKSAIGKFYKEAIAKVKEEE